METQPCSKLAKKILGEKKHLKRLHQQKTSSSNRTSARISSLSSLGIVMSQTNPIQDDSAVNIPEEPAKASVMADKGNMQTPKVCLRNY